MSAGKKLQGLSIQSRAISGMWGLVAMLVLLDWAAVARAQDATTAPPGTRTLSPTTPFQLILPQAHLLGDWYGLRPWLEDSGITPTLTFVTDALGNPTGGREQGFTGANNLGLDLLFNLEKLAGLQGGTFHLSLSQRFGASLSTDYIGNVFTVQQVFGGQTYRLVNVAYQQKLLDGRIEFRLTATRDEDTRALFRQFLCRGEANARAAARDECDLAVQLLAHDVLRFVD